MSAQLALFSAEEAAEPRAAFRVHVYRRDRFLGLLCVMCRVQGDMAALYGFDRAGGCPGLVVPVAAGVGLAGSSLEDRPRWPVSPPGGRREVS